VHVRVILAVDQKLAVLPLAASGLRRIVPELRVLREHHHDIDPEAVDAAVGPAPHRLRHGGAELRVSPVQVDLLGIEGRAVVLARALVERPGRAAEGREPVVGRPAVASWVGPDIPIALGRVS
jgi:hypothetical protein